MLRHMRTTVRLDDSLLNEAKREAQRRNTTLTALIEQGLRLMLRRNPEPARKGRIRLPISRATGGTVPGIDLDDTASVMDRMDGIG